MTQHHDEQPGAKIIVHIDRALAALIPGFLAHRRQDIPAVLAAVEQGDYETIRVVGHSMKGSGGGYGFDAITAMGSALEQAAQDRDPDTIRHWVGELATYLERVDIVYE